MWGFDFYHHHHHYHHHYCFHSWFFDDDFDSRTTINNKIMDFLDGYIWSLIGNLSIFFVVNTSPPPPKTTLLLLLLYPKVFDLMYEFGYNFGLYFVSFFDGHIKLPLMIIITITTTIDKQAMKINLTCLTHWNLMKQRNKKTRKNDFLYSDQDFCCSNQIESKMNIRTTINQ